MSMISARHYAETLVEVRRLLLAMPEKKLAAKRYCAPGTRCYCVLGALAPQEAFDLASTPFWNTHSIGQVFAVGMRVNLKAKALALALQGFCIIALSHLQATNDLFEGQPEERYAHILRLLETHIETGEPLKPLPTE